MDYLARISPIEEGVNSNDTLKADVYVFLDDLKEALELEGRTIDDIVNDFIRSVNTNYIITEDPQYSLCNWRMGKDKIKTIISRYLNDNGLDFCADCVIIGSGLRYVESANGCVCEDCLCDNYFCCECCGEYRQNDYGRSVRNYGQICDECYSNGEFSCCDGCGRYYHNDQLNYHECCDSYYCDRCSCECEDSSGNIYGHDYKPRPIFHGTGKLYMGFELEIDGLTDRSAFADSLIDSMPNGLVYMKTDGSLTDRGLEIVSHPCSPDYLKNEFEFEKMTELAGKYNGTSHNNGNCGFHIHVSRDYFSSYELSATKILYIFEKFWDNLYKLSRRTNTQYCAKNFDVLLQKDYVKNIKRNVTKNGRYFAVNLCNEHTIEFRLWRGTLRIQTIQATIELTHLICMMAENLSIMTLQKMTWEDFKADASEFKMKAFLKYCKRKNI